jgi:hypothetical protein
MLIVAFAILGMAALGADSDSGYRLVGWFIRQTRKCLADKLFFGPS